MGCFYLQAMADKSQWFITNANNPSGLDNKGG